MSELADKYFQKLYNSARQYTDTSHQDDGRALIQVLDQIDAEQKQEVSCFKDLLTAAKEAALFIRGWEKEAQHYDNGVMMNNLKAAITAAEKGEK